MYHRKMKKVLEKLKKEEFKREQKCRDGQCKKLCLFTGELIL